MFSYACTSMYIMSAVRTRGFGNYARPTVYVLRMYTRTIFWMLMVFALARWETDGETMETRVEAVKSVKNNGSQISNRTRRGRCERDYIRPSACVRACVRLRSRGHMARNSAGRVKVDRPTRVAHPRGSVRDGK